MSHTNSANLKDTKALVEENAHKTIETNDKKKTEPDLRSLNSVKTEIADPQIPIDKPANQKQTSKAKKDSFNFAGVANFISIIFNSVSAITNFAEYFSPSKKSENSFIKKATQGGELGTKLFYAVNSVQNMVNRFKVNDFLGMLGYLFDLPIAMFAPQKDIFLWRGFSTGAYTFANGAKEAIQKEEFKNIFDHIKGLGKACNKIISYAEGGFKGFWDNIIASKTGLQSMLAGALLFISPIVWKITGLKFFGTCVRDLGGITQDLAQIKLGYMLDDKEKSLPFYEKLKLALTRSVGMGKIPEKAWPTFFRSGLGVTGGTIFDGIRGILEKVGANKHLVNFATAMTYITDGTGIYLLGRAQDKEIGRDKEAEKSKA